MTFENTAKEINYKRYDPNKRTVSRQIAFERDVAEEMNKIKDVLRIKAGIIVGSSVLVDIGMRYFFQHLEDIGEENAMELVVNGALLKIR